LRRPPQQGSRHAEGKVGKVHEKSKREKELVFSFLQKVFRRPTSTQPRMLLTSLLQHPTTDTFTRFDDSRATDVNKQRLCN